MAPPPVQLPETDRIALSIQQPWAELILQGVKTIEIRAVPTRQRGRIYLYTSRRVSRLECATIAAKSRQISLEELPLGLVVGTVEILECRRSVPDDAVGARVPPAMLENSYSWILGNAQRLSVPWEARYVPFGTWFYPFQRLQTNTRRRRKNGGA